MPEKKPSLKDEKPQRDRFIETAKQVGADGRDAKEAFQKALDEVIRKKKM